MVALNNWSINSVESLFASPVSVGQNLTSYLVDSNSPSEGILLSHDVVGWSVVTCAYVVNGLTCVLNQVLPVSFFTVNWAVRVVRVNRFTWSTWVFWSYWNSLVAVVYLFRHVGRVAINCYRSDWSAVRSRVAVVGKVGRILLRPGLSINFPTVINRVAGTVSWNSTITDKVILIIIDLVTRQGCRLRNRAFQIRWNWFTRYTVVVFDRPRNVLGFGFRVVSYLFVNIVNIINVVGADRPRSIRWRRVVRKAVNGRRTSGSHWLVALNVTVSFTIDGNRFWAVGWACNIIWGVVARVFVSRCWRLDYRTIASYVVDANLTLRSIVILYRFLTNCQTIVQTIDSKVFFISGQLIFSKASIRQIFNPNWQLSVLRQSVEQESTILMSTSIIITIVSKLARCHRISS